MLDGLSIIVLAGFVISMAWYFSRDLSVKRRIRKVPRTPIGQVQPGQVAKIVGSLTFLEPPMRAPLSGRRCTYYEVIVQELRSGRQISNSGTWHRVIREERGQDFLLQDETGCARVRVDGAYIAVVKDKTFESNILHDPSPEMAAFLTAHGIKSTGLLGMNKKLYYTEAALEADELVAAYGPTAAEPNPDPAAGFAGYREQPSRLFLRSEPKVKLYVSDDKSVLG